MNATLNVRELLKLLDDGGELAVLDVREKGVSSHDGHLLLVSSVRRGVRAIVSSPARSISVTK